MIHQFFELASRSIVALCIFAILVSIAVNFLEAKKDKPKKERRSIVATGTMMLFFIAFYFLIKLRIGYFDLPFIWIRIPLVLFGLAIFILGAYVNVKGRLLLGGNWADQIKIYRDHTFISNGVYGIVRHPHYTSLIWMFYAASIIYTNYAAFLANTLIFIPFMYYRAKQEEQLLRKQFKGYLHYSKKVGMFFPRIVK